MTMIEMAMPMMGMGTSSGGACDFSCSLSADVLNRLGKEQGIKAESLNLATAKSELARVDPIGIYRLMTGKTTYRDKVSGNIITEKTLISPDSNYESIGVWTGAGEKGFGSKEEYQAILNRAREFAKTEGEATMFWLSLGKEKRTGGLPEHRAYMWKKGESGEVVAYSYQFTGSKDSLVTTLLNLSSDASFLDPETLLWGSGSFSVSHQRIFSAYQSALTLEEKEKTKEYLDLFRQEAAQPDSVFLERIESDRRKYEKELREVYKDDIEAAIKSVVSGFLALPKLSDEIDKQAATGVEDRENVLLRCDERIAVSFIALGLVAVAKMATLERSELVDKKIDDSSKDETVKKDINEPLTSKEQAIEQVVMPFIPAVLIVMVMLTDMDDSSQIVVQKKEEVILHRQDTGGDILPESRNRITDSSDSGRQRFNRPEIDVGERILKLSDRVSFLFEEARTFIDPDSEIYPTGKKIQERSFFPNNLPQFVTFEESKTSAIMSLLKETTGSKEERIYLIQQFQILLKAVSLVVNTVDGRKISRKIPEENGWKEIAVDLGTKLFKRLLVDKEEKMPQQTKEFINKIAFLLTVYERKDTEEIIKPILVFLIYIEIRQFYPDLFNGDENAVFEEMINLLFEKQKDVHDASFSMEKLRGRQKLQTYKMHPQQLYMNSSSNEVFPHFGIIYHSCNFIQ